MNDADFVSGGETRGDLLRVVDRLGDGQCSALPQYRGKVSSLHERHRDVLRATDLAQIVNAGHVLVRHLPRQLELALEQQLGVRLFQRSTRSLRLTEEGRLFHERCRRILDDLEDAQASLAQAVATPRGRLRVSVPLVSYHLILPILPEFVNLYPEVELDLDFNDRIVDLIEDIWCRDER